MTSMSESGETAQDKQGCSVQDFFFLGVSTGQSSVHAFFERWCQAIDVKARMLGVDIPIGAPKETYERFFQDYMGSPQIIGGLVTSHKAALFTHCSKLFSHLTRDAENLEEIGAVFRQGGGAWAGDASDVPASGLAASKLLTTPQWHSGSKQVVIFGAGGAGLALSITLASLRQPPAEIVLTESRPDRMETVRRILQRVRADRLIKLISSEENQRLVDGKPSGTLFVNASGLGKDLPGSPIVSFANVAKDALVWDFNYRGDLLFLKQARFEQAAKNLVIEDGWWYFISGWAHVICRVFGKECTDEVIRRFAIVAGESGPTSASP